MIEVDRRDVVSAFDINERVSGQFWICKRQRKLQKIQKTATLDPREEAPNKWEQTSMTLNSNRIWAVFQGQGPVLRMVMRSRIRRVREKKERKMEHLVTRQILLTLRTWDNLDLESQFRSLTNFLAWLRDSSDSERLKLKALPSMWGSILESSWAAFRNSKNCFCVQSLWFGNRRL